MKHVKAAATVVYILIVLAFEADMAVAKSVYVITDHHATVMKAYEIQGDKIEYQQNVVVNDYGNGAVDVTIDSNLVKLFISYEGDAKIVWANPKTLKQEGFVDLSVYGVPTLAGIVADEGKSRVYAVSRNSDKLYICSWNDEEKRLELMDPNDPNQPYTGQGDAHITLTDLACGELTGAWGLALDENTDRIYVTDNTNYVHFYDTETWTHLGMRDVGRTAAGVAVSPNDGVQ